jgi:hypothetical protein
MYVEFRIVEKEGRIWIKKGTYKNLQVPYI